ncbi:MAG: 7-carboxy-7-deazaguanine synthase QueE [Mariniblastus sp.]|nr:7-carboxy-7-deazaguanine synthase QueE [Mariniblastus sp.]
MLVSEIYSSRQGEGRLTGQPSIFVRTSGCNLRCDFCDTPYTSWTPEGRDTPIGDVLQEVGQFSPQHVVLTGGEPMLPRSVVELTHLLQEQNYHITIETSGTIFREVHCDLMSISPKLANSTPSFSRAGDWSLRHENARHRPEIVDQLIQRHDYQLKFVVSSPSDVDEIERYLEELSTVNRQQVLLMPEGVESSKLEDRAKWLVPICEERQFTYCPRMHIQWYGNRRGT